MDGVRFGDIELLGEEQWLGELAERLRRKDSRPEAVKRVWMPKPNGKKRLLGIPTIKDREVQTAALIVLETIYSVDLQPEQYAYYLHGVLGLVNLPKRTRDLPWAKA